MKASSLVLGLIFVTGSLGKNIEIKSDYEGSGSDPAVIDHYSGERIICHFNISFNVMNHNGDFM